MEYKRPYQMSVQQRKCGSRATAPRTIVACICVQRTWRHLCEYLRTAHSNHCRKSRKSVSYTHLDVYKRQDEAGVGEITLRDIVKELEKPARDPREDMPKPILRSDVLETVSYTHLT